jgi:hypothetical protein
MAPVTAPDSAEVLLDTPYTLPDGRVANQFDALEWADSGTLRFVAGFEIVDAFARPADTTFLAFAVVELDIAARTITTVAGTDRAFTYVAVGDGVLWYVRRGETVVRTSSDHGTGVVVDFGAEIRSITEASGSPVAIVVTPGAAGPVPTVVAFNTTTSALHTLWTGMYPVRLARVAGRPWVVAAIHRGDRLTRLGGGASLWLLEVR